MDLNSVVVVGKDQISSDLGDEVVILSLQSESYFGLGEVGALVWKLIQEPRPVKEIRDRILDEYEVESARCERDLMDLLRTLTTRGLVEVQANVSL